MKFQFKAYLSKRLVILTVCLVLAAIAAQLSRLHWIFDLATHLTWHYILAGAALSGFLFWLRRPRWAFLAIATALLHVPLIYSYAWIAPSGALTATAQEELQILQFNIGSKNEQARKFYEWLREQPSLPDIVVIIEASEKLKPVVAGMMTEGWPHALADYQEDNYGIAVLSQIKDSDLSLEPIGDPFLPSIIVRGKTDKQNIPFTLLATHPPPPITGTLSKARNQQYIAYADWLNNESVSNRILVGDLNTTPWSFHYQKLLEESNMLDAQAGQGYIGTFPAWLPSLMGIPVDHALISKNIEVVHRKAGPGFTLGSDHRVVMTTVKLAR
ncbi:MAG: endonuclease/exonuclease/phosphatase family protein [Gammaproteobacteria bacterium]|nr:MAG: endonuclease/exonuclease/phosphatase family protein [Gammaproteobacteria bacterium]